MNDEIRDEQYLGDGVYVHHDGYHIWLWTVREDMRHLIALEPEVLERLYSYAEHLRQKYSKVVK